MINLRYHIVSIVAVFLALGIGLALGTTFIDSFIVSELNRNQGELETRIEKDSDTIAELEAVVNETLAENQVFENEAIGTIFARRLVEVPVLVVAVRGAEPSAIEQLRRAVLSSGARYQGVVWVEEQMDISIDGNRILLAEALGLNSQEPTRVDVAIRSAIRREFSADGPSKVANYAGRFGIRLGGEILSGGIESVEHLPIVPSKVRLLTVLDRSNFVEWDRTGMNPSVAPYAPLLDTRFILISSPDSKPGGDAFLRVILEEMQRVDPVPIVVADTGGITSEGLGLAAALRNGDSLKGTVSTVKELGSFEGVTAALLALDGVDVSEPGDWGHGEGTEAVLPPPVQLVR